MNGLPLPGSSSFSKSRHFGSSHSSRFSNSFSSPHSSPYQSSGLNGGTLDLLLQRARVTNLAVVLLGILTLLSLLGNLRHWFGGDIAPATSFSIRASLPPPTPLLASLTHLIVVPGHSLWLGHDASKASQPDQWLLEPYQDGRSVAAWLEHVRKGAEEVVKDPSSLLVFSGGHTRPSAPSPGMTEASSYAALAAAMDLYGPRAPGTLERVTTEEFALDSFENLLFSVARFKEFTNHYPTKITVIGYTFKEHRFLHLHRPAIHFPTSQFTYIGTDGTEPLEDRYFHEKSVVAAFERDIYGCGEGLGGLGKKRRNRNGGRRWHGYLESAKEMRGLMEWCPEDGRTAYEGGLPW